MNKSRNSFPKNDAFGQQIHLETIQTNQKSPPFGGGLHKKLKLNHKIRESVEMDLNASLVCIYSV